VVLSVVLALSGLGTGASAALAGSAAGGCEGGFEAPAVARAWDPGPAGEDGRGRRSRRADAAARDVSHRDSGAGNDGPSATGENGTGFFGAPDAPVVTALAEQPIAAIEKGRGGRTLAFKITLADGTAGYFKPEQSFSGAHWYAEIAAYHLDRALGLGRVPPVVGRRMPWGRLHANSVGDERVDEVTVEAEGTVRGAFIWWVPEGLERIRPGRRWERWIRLDGYLGITPYQRPARFRRAVAARRDGDDPLPERDAPEAGDHPEIPGRAAELSDLIVFDYLTHNVDRWGGNFTNVRTRGDDGPIVFFDNGAAFYWNPRIPLMDARLEYLQRFRRETIDAVRGLEREDLEDRLARDPLAPVLDDHLIDGVFERRAHLLEHVDETVARFGPQRVYFD